MNWVTASRKRRLLAFYIDLMLLSTAWAIVDFLGRITLPALADWPDIARFGISGVVALLAYRLWGWSLGCRLLGIRTFSAGELNQPASAANTGKGVVVVDRGLIERESWLTILLGILLINEGAKGLVRWSMWDPPFPFFGVPTDGTTSAVLSVCLGSVEVYAGVSFLMLWPRAVWIALGVYALELGSIVAGWDLWDAVFAEAITRRREYQGLPVRPGEIERMQAYMPEMMVAWAGVTMVLIVVAWPRLRLKRLVVPEERRDP